MILKQKCYNNSCTDVNNMFNNNLLMSIFIANLFILLISTLAVNFIYYSTDIVMDNMLIIKSVSNISFIGSCFLFVIYVVLINQ